MAVMPITRVIVRGVVQGVGFRDFVARNAQKHGAEGWVRNRRDGSVEAVFAGSQAVVQAILEACRRGPHGSRVDDVAQFPGTEGDLARRHPGEAFSWLAMD
jgi:acylphosphatase